MKLEDLCLRVAETAILFLEKDLGYKIPNRLIFKAARKAADPKVPVSYTHLTLPTTPYV